jgi:hypothetical protein
MLEAGKRRWMVALLISVKFTSTIKTNSIANRHE